jgi:hypothetical protein
MHRQDQHASVPAASGNLFQRTHAAGPRHREIQQCHIRSRVAGCLNGPIAIWRFRNDFDIGLRIDQHFQPRAENGVIVCDQDPDFLHSQAFFETLRPLQRLRIPFLKWELHENRRALESRRDTHRAAQYGRSFAHALKPKVSLRVHAIRVGFEA